MAIGPLGGWLAAARRDGRFETVTALRRADGQPFAARLTLTPLPDGYEGAAQALPEMSATAAMPPIAPALRLKAWAAIARAPFLTATLAPVVFAGAWVFERGLARPFPWLWLVLSMIAAALLHVSANLLNDYFDWMSGADPINADFFAPFSGGSRAIDLGLLSSRGMLVAGLASLATSTAIGVLIGFAQGLPVLWFGLAGAAAAWFYTAPPLRLVARRGLGELTVLACFGPLMVAGAVFAMTGRVEPAAFLAGLPLGLFTAAILWINEIPDAPADRAAGKANLVVVLGPARAARGYVVLMALSFLSVVGAVLAGAIAVGGLAALLALPLAIKASKVALAHYGDRQLIAANAGTIQTHLAVGVLLAVGTVASALLR